MVGFALNDGSIGKVDSKPEIFFRVLVDFVVACDCIARAELGSKSVSCKERLKAVIPSKDDYGSPKHLELMQHQ